MEVTSVKTAVQEILRLSFETEVAYAPSAAKEERQKIRRTLSHCCSKTEQQQDLCKPQIPIPSQAKK